MMTTSPLERELKSLSRQIESSYGPPVLVIGMHRSGTSVVTRLLRAAGGYFGSRLDPNEECITFMRFNHSILNSQGMRWNVVPADFDLEALGADERVLACVIANRHLLWSGFFETFGEPAEARYALRPEEYQLPPVEVRAPSDFSDWPAKTGAAPFWGWKDPRSTLTWAFWLRLFPGARIIHVVRNGIDSALSLRRRCLKTGEGRPQCRNLEYCFELWERYVEAGLRCEAVSKGRYHEVRYEDMLRDPVHEIGRLLTFSGASGVNAESLSEYVDDRASSVNRWDDQPALLERARRSELFGRLGYGGLLGDRGGEGGCTS